MAAASDWGRLSNGGMAHKYTIESGRIKAVLSDIGASLIELWVRGEDGVSRDVVWGFDEPITYETASPTYFGSTVGRNANRTGSALAMINGECYALERNEGENNLHSGPNGYNTRLWQAEELSESGVSFTLHSPDGDQGFPGNADIRVRYSIENGCELKLSYSAVADRETVFNLTNHSYFNLDGEASDSAMSHLVQINAKYYNPVRADSIPTGEIAPVEGTPMDFRKAKPLGRDIGEAFEQLRLTQGYDHNYCLTGGCDRKMQLAATLTGAQSGISMQVFTDLPGVQFYCGNYLNNITGKRGREYPNRSAVCFETQFWPDNTKHSAFPKSITPANTLFKSETVFKFI